MIKSNIVLDGSSSVAAYMVWEDSISSLVMGRIAVDAMRERASKDNTGTLYLFTDRGFAIREYASEVNRLHSGKNRYADFEQSIGE